MVYLTKMFTSHVSLNHYENCFHSKIYLFLRRKRHGRIHQDHRRKAIPQGYCKLFLSLFFPLSHNFLFFLSLSLSISDFSNVYFISFQELFQNSSLQVYGPIKFAHQWIDMSNRQVLKHSSISSSSLMFKYNENQTN
jgi:hypothetical protein